MRKAENERDFSPLDVSEARDFSPLQSFLNLFLKLREIPVIVAY